MADPVKRVHYFDRQFLRVEDFTQEQDYHQQARRRHSRVQHTWGIASGLDLSFAAGATRVTIGEGEAIDSLGREIVLADNATRDVSNFANRTVFVTIAYAEAETDPTEETGVRGNTRWTETPAIDVTQQAPQDPSLALILGRLTIGAGGAITGKDDGVDPNRRRAAGVVGGDLEVRSLTLTDPGISASRWVRMRLAAVGQVSLAGDLHVTGDAAVDGNIAVGGTVDGRDVAADGTALDAHVRATNNPHGTTAAQAGALASVDGVSNPGGNIDLIQANAITLAPDNTNKRITVGETHSARTDNPHGTTAAQAGALPAAGGTVGGRLNVNEDQGFVSLFLTNNWTGTAPSPVGVLSVMNSTGGYGWSSAAVAGVSMRPNTFGLYASAPTGTHAIFCSGTLFSSGGKTGYVVDTFRNASGQRLQTGDLVKLKGTPIVRFYGQDNKIPVAEVTLTDRPNDPLVIGIVDREAIPLPDAPDTRVEADDPTFVEDGGELVVVTLGCYSHCRVDATEAPIAVGDLLTSSANPGHARKATETSIGSIIGKALEPLPEGTGYIAVFVNIQ